MKNAVLRETLGGARPLLPKPPSRTLSLAGGSLESSHDLGLRAGILPAARRWRTAQEA